MNSLTNIRTKLEQYKGRKQQKLNDLKRYKIEFESAKNEMEEWEQARVILQQVVQKTQETLSYRIGEMGSLALEAIFDDPYKVCVDFVPRRGRTEAEIYFERGNGKFADPLNEIGGGSCDVGSFGLVFSMWSLRVPRSRALMLFDEPFRNLDRYEDLKRAERASKLIKKISTKNKMQVIMVTHNRDFIEQADKVIDIG
jgi:hypothetical protein